MQVLTSPEQFNQIKPGCVLTIGNFDGVHTGHREILERARAIARQQGTTTVVMTFDPHPVAVLYPERAPKVLTPLAWKLHLLQEYTDDCIIVLKDSRQLLSLSARQFVDEFLMQTIRPSVIVEGDDFHFGAGRRGSIETLREFGSEKGFGVEVVEPHIMTFETGQTLRVSSTVVRYMLEGGHVHEAALALGRSFRLYGPVISGRGKGREIGYPTINMQKGDQILPAEGVYAGTVEVAPTPEALFGQSQHLPAAISIGQARTFGDEHPLLIEAHLLVKHVPEVAEKWVAMDFVRRLRSQHKFKSVDDLVAQITRDCTKARDILGVED